MVSFRQKGDVMKTYILTAVVLMGCMAHQARADSYCYIDQSKCPTVECPAGTFLGNDGQCWSCLTDNDVNVACLDARQIPEVCPNRTRSGSRCSAVSILTSKMRMLEEKNRVPFWARFFDSFFHPFEKGESGVYYDITGHKYIDVSPVVFD